MSRLFLTRVGSIGLIAIVSLTIGCTEDNLTKNINPSVSANPTILVTPTLASSSALSIETAAINPTTHPLWETIEDWIPANQIRVLLIDKSNNLWTGGPGGLVHWNLETSKPTVYVLSAKPEETNVIALNQTPDNAVWVGTFGNGVSKFDGMNWQSFTIQDGLPGNYLISQTLSSKGEVWLSLKMTEQDYDPGQQFYFGRFDGKKWSKEVGGDFWWIAGLPSGSIMGARGDTGIAKHDSVIGIYDNQEWKDLGLAQQTIKAVAVAPDGVIWIATDNDIFLYVNKMWKRIIPPWARKDFASVSSIAVAVDGTAWFGFSFGAGDFDKCGIRMDYAQEVGVYYYDGKNWTQFTTDDGLVDNKICAITFDSDGNVWFGSFDKGVSRFDGHNWKTYAIP